MKIAKLVKAWLITAMRWVSSPLTQNLYKSALKPGSATSPLFGVKPVNMHNQGTILAGMAKTF
jgi:hypothetical protein